MFKAWEVENYGQAEYLLLNGGFGVIDFASPWMFLPKAAAFLRSEYDAHWTSRHIARVVASGASFRAWSTSPYIKQKQTR